MLSMKHMKLLTMLTVVTMLKTRLPVELRLLP